jgi:hypothetical protein
MAPSVSLSTLMIIIILSFLHKLKILLDIISSPSRADPKILGSITRLKIYNLLIFYIKILLI